MKSIVDNKNEYISGGARDLRRYGIHVVADEKLNAHQYLRLDGLGCRQKAMVFDAVEDQLVASALQSKKSEPQ